MLMHCVSAKGQVDTDVPKKLYKVVGQKSHIHR